MSNLDPANLLLLMQGIFWFLSSACQLIVVQTKFNSGSVGHHLFAKGERCSVFSLDVSLEGHILLKSLLAVVLPVYLQFCVVNLWLDVLK